MGGAVGWRARAGGGALAFALAASAAAAASPEVARGEAVARGFCYTCHDRDSTQGALNPLRPKLRPERWGSVEQAYENVGRLRELNPNMVLPFRGPDADRRALAAYLASLADANRPSRVRRGLQAALLAGAVALAGAWAWRRSRSRP